MNIDGLVVATLIFACVFLVLSILMIEIHGITGFFIELQASLSGLGKIGILAGILLVCLMFFLLFSKEVSRESYAVKSYDADSKTVEYIVDDNATGKMHYTKEIESSNSHVEVVRRQWLFLYSENCYLYLNKQKNKK